MNRTVAKKRCRVCSVTGACLALLLVAGGCEPIGADTVSNFLTELSRGLLAAWLL